MSNFIGTDLGYFSKENLKWLIDKKILTYNGNIMAKPYKIKRNINGVIKEADTSTWSQYVHIHEFLWSEVKNGLPKDCMVTRDDIVTIMRTHKLEMKYKSEGQEFVHTYKLDNQDISDRLVLLEKNSW